MSLLFESARIKLALSKKIWLDLLKLSALLWTVLPRKLSEWHRRPWFYRHCNTSVDICRLRRKPLDSRKIYSVRHCTADSWRVLWVMSAVLLVDWLDPHYLCKIRVGFQICNLLLNRNSPQPVMIKNNVSIVHVVLLSNQKILWQCLTQVWMFSGCDKSPSIREKCIMYATAPQIHELLFE